MIFYSPGDCAYPNLTSDSKYKKGKAKIQDDALYLLRTAGETFDAIHDEIPLSLVNQAADTEFDDFERLDNVLALEEGAASGRSDLVHAFCPEEILREQAVDQFCNRQKKKWKPKERQSSRRKLKNSKVPYTVNLHNSHNS